MDNRNQFSRRRFLKLSVLGTGSILLFSQCSGFNPKWRFFTNSEAQLMDALADQIIPPDEWPGGMESGVTNFIDKQLIGPYNRFQTEYRKGLKAVQDSCDELFNKQFEELAWNDQTSFLEMLEAGKLKQSVWDGGFDHVFFGLIRDHSMQAYYGSSRHGGNKNNMSYKMLKLDYPLIIGQNRYIS